MGQKEHYERVRERLAEIGRDEIDVIEAGLICLAMKNDDAARNLNFYRELRQKCRQSGIEQYLLLEEVFGHPNMNRLQLEQVRI